MTRQFSIGQLAKVAGVPPKTIRYYESVGVLPPPNRNDARYRVYSEIDVRRLELVRRARTLDMGLPEIRELVHCASTGTCNDFQERFQEVLRRKLEEVDHRIGDLEHLREDLQRLEAHLTLSQKEAIADHTVLECSPETCTCLGDTRENPSQLLEVKLWLNRSESKS